jgi:serine/threonine protein kinase
LFTEKNNFLFKALQKIRHPNVIKLKEVIREDNNLYMIFEVIFFIKILLK